MSSCFRSSQSLERKDKTTFLIRNGKILLEKLITSCNGKYNPIRSFTAEELKAATNNFDRRKVITSEPPLSKLYKGFLQDRPVSIMKFEDELDADHYCFNSIVFASQMSHKSILKLIGCCLETQIPILVFESIAFGTLSNRIHGSCQTYFQPLLLSHRLKIAMEIAHAIAYLHAGFPRPIVARTICPRDILFNEKGVAKLFDFSLFKSIPEDQTYVTDEVRGTNGFISPEYLYTGKYNEMCDVYSFGMFLLELLTGRIVFDIARLATDENCLLLEYVKKHIANNRLNEIIDPIVAGEGSYPGKERQLQAFIQLIIKCANTLVKDRPTMIDVAKQLRQIYMSAI